MARAPRETPQALQLPETSEALTQDMAATDALSVAANNYTAERDLMNQMWGQIQMADAVSKLTTVVSLQKLAYIKDSKLYRALRGKTAHDKDGDEIADVGTWDGFCRAIGSSRTKVDEDLTNLAAFGEDALNHLSAIGAGYRELRQYRQLPTDEKTALIEAAQSGDKDSFLDLAESIIAKHAAEREALKNDLQESKDNYEALGAQLRRKDQRINEQDAEITALQRRISGAGFSSEEALQRLDGVTLEVVGKVLSEFNGAISELLNTRSISDLSRAERQAIASALGRVRLAVADVSEAFGIAPSEAEDATQGVDETDEIWARTLADIDAQEGARHDGDN